MKRRRILKIGHFVMLLFILIWIPVTMFFPVLHMDQSVIVGAVGDMKLTDEQQYEFLERMSESLKETPAVSASAFEVLTADYSQLELEGEIKEGVEESLWKIQFPMWIMYLGALPCLVLVLVIFMTKRTKFVVVISSAVYGAAGIVGSTLFIWGTPGMIREQLEQVLSSPSQFLTLTGLYTSEQQKQFYEIFERFLSAVWSHMLSSGMYLTFGSFLLLFVALVVVSLTGRKETVGSGEAAGIPFMQSTRGGVQCLWGELAGAQIGVDHVPLYIGSDPQRCQIVVNSPYAVLFSLSCDGYAGGYQVECYAPDGLYYQIGYNASDGLYDPNRYGGWQQLPSGGRYQLPSGTQLGINPGQGIFILV